MTEERNILNWAAVGSTRQRNGFAQLFGWGVVTKGLSRPLIEPSSDFVRVRLRVPRKIYAVGKVLLQQASRVFV